MMIKSLCGRVALSLCTLLTACNSGDSAPATPADTRAAATLKSEPVTVTLWHSYRAGEEKALAEVVEQFNKERTDIHLETLKIPHQAFADKITAAIPRNNGPDLFIFAHDRVGDWADSGHIEPVSTWARPDLLQEFYPETVRALVYKKSLYGLPLAFKSVVLFYNKELVPKPPRTDVELVAIAKAHTDAPNKHYGLVYENTLTYFNAPFIHGFGGSILDDRGNLGLLDPGTSAGLAFSRSLVEPHGVVPADVNSNLVTSLFNTGRAALVISGPWFRGEIAPGVKWGVAVMPTVTSTGRKMAPYVASEAVMMSAKSEQKEEAFQVMRYLTTGKAARTRMEVGGQPVAHKASWDAAPEDLEVFRAQLSDSVIMPNAPMMRRVWSPLDSAIYKIVKNGEPPGAALTAAVASIGK
jgi:maltose-binding protein MalE